MSAVEICHLYISIGHNFVGHHGREPDTHPMIEVPLIECVAGHGIRGDRYVDFKDDYKGQITFFSLDVFDELRAALSVHDCSPAATRRNVITRAVDLNGLIAQEFEVPGAQHFLKGRGGLRAKILSDGQLQSTARILEQTG